jgi:predicted nuclease with TOPRIM domain
MLNDFNERSFLSEEQIDKQIAHYEDKIKQLQSMKNNMDNEKRKLELKSKIDENKRLLDEKLDEFSKNLDNEEMKKRLTDEMTQINQVIKQLESELQSLS